jgi:hypothetical protein
LPDSSSSNQGTHFENFVCRETDAEYSRQTTSAATFPQHLLFSLACWQIYIAMPPFSEDGHEESPVAALLALSAKLRNHEVEMRRNRKVRFAPDNIFLVEAIPVECRPFYWMSRKEFDDIKKDCGDTVARSKLDKTVVTRGLESSLMTGEAFLQTYLHRRGAIRSVLKEQLFQKETGYKDVDDIADGYSVYAKKSLEKARTRAQHDELACRC